MVWKKIKEGIEFWEKPCLGTVKPKQGKRFMALCVDSSSKKGNYFGLARQVINREGSEDVPGFTDLSKLVIVRSKDLLNWEVVGDLRIRNIEEIIEKFQKDETKFIGLEDPDIVVDEKNLKHVYFTIAYKYLDKEKHDIYLGHAFGKNLKNLKATNPVLNPISEEIEGFKELAPSIKTEEGNYFHLAECLIRKESESFSAIATIRARNFGKDWKFEKISLHPRQQKYGWCDGEASPCRILPRQMIDVGKELRVLIMNGREPTTEKRGKRVYGDFLPGLALYNTKTGEIPLVASKPLFKDTDSTGITFASEVVPFDEEHFILYAHVNDSFVRTYRVRYREIRKLLPKNN